MKEKFSRTFFSKEKEFKAPESFVLEREIEYSKKYGQKQAGRMQHAIKQETQDVLAEIHGQVFNDYDENSSDDEERRFTFP